MPEKEFKPEIIVDSRESQLIIYKLEKLGAHVTVKTISPGDYIVAEGFAVERKTFEDFLRSIFDKRLFDQIERLSNTYERHCLIIEGSTSYGLSTMNNPLVFWGALSKIIAEYGTIIIFTMNEYQTADFLFSLAKKLQEAPKEKLIARYKPKARTLSDMQMLAVQGLPTVGPKMARKLLEKFKTVRQVFSASASELMKVKGIGKKRASLITKFLDSPYEKEGCRTLDMLIGKKESS